MSERRLTKFSELPWFRTQADDKTAALVSWACNLIFLVGPLFLIYSLNGQVIESIDWTITTPWKWLLAILWVMFYHAILVSSQWQGANE